MPSLTPRQAKFVSEYATDFNGTQAAIRAGFSAATASQIASRLLRNVKVAAELVKLKAQIESTSIISREEIIRGWAEMARAKIDSDKMTWTDKRGALDSLAKSFGLFQDGSPGGSVFQITIHVGGSNGES
jgi:phage terminase small subunit